MAIFIDSSSISEIEEICRWGIISGATTNPKILSKDKFSGNLRDTVVRIIDIVRGPVSVEITEETEDAMIKQAEEFASWDKDHIVIKVPMCIEGLKVVNILENEKGIKTNTTCIMSFNQAYLAALAGSTYVSIFSGRIRDMGYGSDAVIGSTAQMIARENLKSRIIVGSIRHLMDVNQAFLAGAHIVTITPEILRKMVWNPRTESTIEEFNCIWCDMKKKGQIK